MIDLQEQKELNRKISQTIFQVKDQMKLKIFYFWINYLICRNLVKPKKLIKHDLKLERIKPKITYSQWIKSFQSYTIKEVFWIISISRFRSDPWKKLLIKRVYK